MGADMPAKLTIVRHPDQLAAILSSSAGGVYRDMFRRCVNVQSQAKKNLELPPHRVDTGRLRSDIIVQMIMVGDRPVGRVGFNVFYGVFVHEGTGIYGWKGVPIVPSTAHALRWKTKSGWAYAPFVKGMRPNPFLKNAMSAAKP